LRAARFRPVSEMPLPAPTSWPPCSGWPTRDLGAWLAEIRR